MIFLMEVSEYMAEMNAVNPQPTKQQQQGSISILTKSPAGSGSAEAQRVGVVWQVR